MKQEVKISRKLMEHLMWLARVELSEDEIEEFLPQLSKILEFFRMMDEVPTENVEPLTHVVTIKNAVRDDRPEPGLEREEALANAPERENGYFKAPKII